MDDSSVFVQFAYRAPAVRQTQPLVAHFAALCNLRLHLHDFYTGLAAIHPELDEYEWAAGKFSSKGVAPLRPLAGRLKSEVKPLLAKLASEIIAQARMEGE